MAVQVHCIYKPHLFFYSYLFPQEIFSKHQFEDQLMTMGDNEVLALQCSSFQTAFINGVSKGDATEYFFCRMEDGVLLVKRPNLKGHDSVARFTVEFGDSKSEALSDALFMAGKYPEISPPVEELAEEMSQFVFVEMPPGRFVFLAGMYILYGWLLPAGYIVIQCRRLDLIRFVQLLSEDRLGKVKIVSFVVLGIAVNVLVYARMHDINSFAGSEWRDVKRFSGGFEAVLQSVDFMNSRESIEDLAVKHQEFLEKVPQEEITGPLKMVRKIDRDKKTASLIKPDALSDTKTIKEITGLFFTDQAGNKQLFQLSAKDFEKLYLHSYLASTRCLQPETQTYGAEHYPLSIRSVRDERRAVALLQESTSRWTAQNRRTAINSKISTVADCESKTVYWLFDKNYYASLPMEKFTQKAEESR